MSEDDFDLGYKHGLAQRAEELAANQRLLYAAQARGSLAEKMRDEAERALDEEVAGNQELAMLAEELREALRVEHASMSMRGFPCRGNCSVCELIASAEGK